MAPDRLSLLPHEVLVSILSFLPQKAKVRTSVLSPRFRNIWRYSEKLSIYGDHRNHLAITDFINNHLPSYLAPVLRIFKIKLIYDDYRNADIVNCLRFVVSRAVENLFVSCEDLGFHVFIPVSVFNCNSLRELKIYGNSIMVFVPSRASLPSLKKLEIIDVEFLSTEAVQRLLAASPVLQSFKLGLRNLAFAMAYTVCSNSLENLYIRNGDNVTSIVVNTPSLKTLTFMDRTFGGEGGVNDGQNLVLTFEKLPSLEEVSLDVCEIDLRSLMQAITSVKKLSICSSRDLHLTAQGLFFEKLENLKLCRCAQCCIDFYNLLQACPNVSVLTIHIDPDHEPTDFSIVHAPPRNLVPACTLAKLETLIWTDYSHQPPCIVYMYDILMEATALVNVHISFREELRFKNRARNNLLSVVRASARAQLNFQGNEERLWNTAVASPVLQSFKLGLRNLAFAMAYTVCSNSLENLYIRNGDNVTSIVVNTPSLKTLTFMDRTFGGEGGVNDGQNLVLTFEKLPSLEEVSLDVCEIDLRSLMQAITSVKKLSICSSRDLHLTAQGLFFEKLENLKLCRCAQCCIDFYNLLQACPNVSVLTIHIDPDHEPTDFSIVHAPPRNLVPACTLAKLETLIWTDYSHQPPCIVYMYDILMEATALVNVHISFREELRFKNRARNNLLSVVRASARAQLNFQGNEE